MISNIYLAAVEPGRWPVVVKSIADKAEVACASVLLALGDDPATALFEVGAESPAVAQGLRPQCLQCLAQNPGPWSGVSPATSCGPATLVNGESMFRACVRVGDGADGRGAICLYQSERVGPVSRMALDFAAELAPHVGYALPLRRRRLQMEEMVIGLSAATAMPVARADNSQVFGVRYGLTERELAVCEQFLKLASVEDTAKVLGVEVSTVRFHLKGIYTKTHVRTLPALMRMLVESLQMPRPGA